jgi:hypothetical protein
LVESGRCGLACNYEPIARIVYVEGEQFGVAALPLTRFNVAL